MKKHKAKILRVIDGDTFVADVVMFTLRLVFDFCITVHKVVTLRLYGVDTPEIRTKNKKEKKRGLLVKSFVQSLLEEREVDVIIHKKDNFGRWLAEVFIGEQSLGILLFLKGYAEATKTRRK